MECHIPRDDHHVMGTEWTALKVAFIARWSSYQGGL